MRFLLQVVGFGLFILGLYLLGSNIFFTTNVYPYFWRGIAADASILLLTAGILALILLPRGTIKSIGWVFIGLSVLCIFVSSRTILNPTSLWQFFLSMVSLVAGYRLMTSVGLIFEDQTGKTAPA